MGLILLVGPVAVGKTTIREQLVKRFNMLPFQTCTTRPIREEEKREDAVPQYHFLSQETFDRWVNEEKFHEHESFAGKSYGTLKEDILTAIDSPETWVGVVDIRGAMSLKRDFPDIQTIFIKPPSQDELVKRVMKRGTETSEEQMERLRIAIERELPFAENMDDCIVNESLDLAILQVVEKTLKKVK